MIKMYSKVLSLLDEKQIEYVKAGEKIERLKSKIGIRETENKRLCEVTMTKVADLHNDFAELQAFVVHLSTDAVRKLEEVAFQFRI